MAGDGEEEKTRLYDVYKGRITPYVILSCIVASSGGLLLGYDLGVYGSPHVFQLFSSGMATRPSSSSYQKVLSCRNYQNVTAFVSSIYLAGLVASLVASRATKSYGRRPSIIFGGLSFLLGSVLTLAAVNVPMLVLGRLMHGFGVGFANQAVPLYLSEMAPTNLRGGFNALFQLAITLGALASRVIYRTTGLTYWKVLVSLAGYPALVMTLGGWILPESPSSLIERGHFEDGRRLLTMLRGTEDVDAEYEDMKQASLEPGSSTFSSLFTDKRIRPQLLVAITLSCFEQLTGIRVVMFYAPLYFPGDLLYCALIIGAIGTLTTLVCMLTVDKWGRRVLLLVSGILMSILLVIMAVLFRVKWLGNGLNPKDSKLLVFLVMCFYITMFTCSWGPLHWLVPSEIFPLKTRSFGQGLTVSVNFFCMFVMAEVLFPMVCMLRYGTFLFFAGWVVIMTVFVYLFLPETKNVPLERMVSVWKKHWLWKRV